MKMDDIIGKKGGTCIRAKSKRFKKWANRTVRGRSAL
jgi:hypothetical protein